MIEITEMKKFIGIFCALVLAQGVFAATYTITWMVDGSVHATTTSGNNKVGSLPSSPSDNGDWKFWGWTDAASISSTTTPTKIATNTKVSKNVTYYAVFAKYGYQYVKANTPVNGETYIFLSSGIAASSHYVPCFRTSGVTEAVAKLAGRKASPSNNIIAYENGKYVPCEVVYEDGKLLSQTLYVCETNNEWYLSQEINSSCNAVLYNTADQKMHVDGSTRVVSYGTPSWLDYVTDLFSKILGTGGFEVYFYVNGNGSTNPTFTPYCKTPTTTFSEFSTSPIVTAPDRIDVTQVGGSEVEKYKDLDLSETNIIVHNNAKWDVSVDIKVGDILVMAGGSLTVSDYTVLRANSLMLQGGYTDVEMTNFDVPNLMISSKQSTIATTREAAYHILIDNNYFYPFAVPCDVPVSSIDYAEEWIRPYSNYGIDGQYVIKRYNGQRRADYGKDADNWEVVPETETLHPGEGYIISAYPVNGVAELLIPLNLSVKSSDVTVHVNANKTTTGKGDWHEGWNYIALPYMADARIKANGAIRYVSVPDYKVSQYTQQVSTSVDLNPFWGCFVQVNAAADIQFTKAASAAVLPLMAPAYRTGNGYPAAPIDWDSINWDEIDMQGMSLDGLNLDSLYWTLHAEELEELEEEDGLPLVEILLRAENGQTDHIGLLMDEEYSSLFEINADLEKMRSAQAPLEVYTIANSGMELVYNAFNPAETTSIPVGYRTGAGTYTFSLDDRFATTDEQILLYDNFTGITTNLLLSDYTFDTDAVEDETRFVLLINRAPAVPTNLDNLHSSMRAFGEQNILVVSGLEGEGVLWVYDIEGKLVARNTYTTATARMDVPAGVYMVRAEGNTNGMVKAIVK